MGYEIRLWLESHRNFHCADGGENKCHALVTSVLDTAWICDGFTPVTENRFVSVSRCNRRET